MYELHVTSIAPARPCGFVCRRAMQVLIRGCSEVLAAHEPLLFQRFVPGSRAS